MKTLVDTTVIANALLKAKAERGSAILAIKRFEESFAPVYAIKELKAGPLKNYIWFHNKLALSCEKARSLNTLRFSTMWSS